MIRLTENYPVLVVYKRLYLGLSMNINQFAFLNKNKVKKHTMRIGDILSPIQMLANI